MQRNQDKEDVSQSSSQSAPSRLENNQCPICFESYTKQNRRYKVCEGKHYVCMECILQLHTKQCPLCKRWFKIQKKENNKLKILKGQREEQPVRAFPGSVRALLLLIYARRHGQLPEQLIEALLMSDIDQQSQSRISNMQPQINIIQNEEQNQLSNRIERREHNENEQSSFSIISQPRDHFARNQDRRDRQMQLRSMQLSLHQQQSSSDWSIIQNVVVNNRNQRRQIQLSIDNMVQQKSCECSFFVALEQGFNKILNFFRNQNNSSNQQENIQI